MLSYGHDYVQHTADSFATFMQFMDSRHRDVDIFREAADLISALTHNYVPLVRMVIGFLRSGDCLLCMERNMLSRIRHLFCGGSGVLSFSFLGNSAFAALLAGLF
ncbi:hypothetical protein D9M71_547340 [compost metagenome]